MAEGAAPDAAGDAGGAGRTSGASGGASTAGAASSGGGRDRPPGLFAQFAATRDALMSLVRAHVALGRAEAEEIKGEVLYLAGFVAIAFAALLLLGVFLPIVTMLFVGEWLFGSIGWGVLLGSELLLVIASTAVVVGLKLDGPRQAAIVALVVGVVSLFIYGASWFNRLWTWLGDAANVTIDPAVRTLIVAIVAVGVVGAVIGLVVGARATGVGGAVVGLFGGFVAGGFVGAFFAYDFGWRVGTALALATGFAVYLAALGARVASAGIDQEVLKARFWPQETIDTTRETIEWAKAKNPLAPKS